MTDGPRSVTILGSTGSIGRSTVDVLRQEPAAYRVEALVGNRNVALLAEQVRALKPAVAVVGDDTCYADLKEALAGEDVEIAAGPQAVIDAAARPVDWVMSAITGAAGLEPTLAAVRQGTVVALANKESLVCAGEVVMAEVAEHGATLLPVDSEHNAIFQVFDFDRRAAIDRIHLTASGGPFRTWSRQDMADVTPEQAIAHPNWSMGAKISVDSATMMNKGLELIEAHHIFAVPEERIDILVHPQSVIHSMVSYIDGSVLAQLGSPDMRTPIAYALGWPDRISAPTKRLDLAEVAQLTFERPDSGRFPALDLARAALREGGGAPTLMNAANEVAVASFLAREIGFLDIAEVVERTLERVSVPVLNGLDDVHAADAEARRVAAEVAASCTPAVSGKRAGAAL